MGSETRHQNKVGHSAAHHLIRDADLPALGIFRRWLHPGSSCRDAARSRRYAAADLAPLHRRPIACAPPSPITSHPATSTWINPAQDDERTGGKGQRQARTGRRSGAFVCPRGVTLRNLALALAKRALPPGSASGPSALISCSERRSGRSESPRSPASRLGDDPIPGHLRRRPMGGQFGNSRDRLWTPPLPGHW